MAITYLPNGFQYVPAFTFDESLNHALTRDNTGRIVWVQNPNNPSPTEVLVWDPSASLVKIQGIANQRVDFQPPRYSNASLPAAGIAGRLVFNTDTQSPQWDTGVVWLTQIGVSGSVTANGVAYGSSGGTILFTAQGPANSLLSANVGAPVFSSSPTVTGLTATGTLVSPSIGPSGAQQHTLPAVASDIIALLSAAQTLSNKTLTTPTIASILNGGTLTLPSGTDTLVGRATVDTLTNKTLSSPTLSGTVAGAPTWGSAQTFPSGTTLASPVINGTPTGTGIPTLTMKSGSGGGDYTIASASLADVDSTNLAFTVTVPSGYKILINSAFCCKNGGLGNVTNVVLADGTTVLTETFMDEAVGGDRQMMGLTYVFVGDGASHTFKLRWAAGAGTSTMSNSSATLTPRMTFLMSPSQ